MTEPKRASWRDVLPIHPAAEMFEPLPPDELKALGEDIRKHGLQQPIIILSESNGEGLLLDGRNRLDAMERAGIKFNLYQRKNGLWKLDVLEEDVPHPLWDLAVRTVSDDPYAFVISANIHRRHLTAERKRELIAELVTATPEKSDRQIAATIKASPSTVGKVRKQLEQTGDVSKLDTRTDAKGRRQAAHKPTVTTAADRAEARSTATTTSTVPQPRAEPEIDPSTLSLSPSEQHDRLDPDAAYIGLLVRLARFTVLLDEEVKRFSHDYRVEFLVRIRATIDRLLKQAADVSKLDTRTDADAAAQAVPQQGDVSP
jgi:ParB-like chromosome segregation protein Spo0J